MHTDLPPASGSASNPCDLADLDPGIRFYVETLRAGGVETFESCEGGQGHAYPEPTVRFHGHAAAGLHALAVALTFGLPVAELRRVWPIIDREPTGPHWEMTFSEKGPTHDA